MDDGLRIVTEMHQALWDQFRGSFDDLTEDELHWRVLPQANSINVIVRHLRIESEWHLRSIQSGEPMPTIAVPVSQEAIDAVPFDFAENLNTLQRLYTAFCDTLGTQSLGTLKAKSQRRMAKQQRASDSLTCWRITKPRISLITRARFGAFVTSTARRGASRCGFFPTTRRFPVGRSKGWPCLTLSRKRVSVVIRAEPRRCAPDPWDTSGAAATDLRR